MNSSYVAGFDILQFADMVQPLVWLCNVFLTVLLVGLIVADWQRRRILTIEREALHKVLEEHARVINDHTVSLTIMKSFLWGETTPAEEGKGGERA